MRGRLCLTVEQRGRRMSVAVESLRRIAPRLCRRDRAPVEIALRRAADGCRRNSLRTGKGNALARSETDPLRMTIDHRLVDRAEIDAPQVRWRHLGPARRAAKRLQDIEHPRLN